jgi:UDP-glucose 4-epimerase
VTRPEKTTSTVGPVSDWSGPGRHEFLRIYLADHHAGSIGGVALAKRLAQRDGEIGSTVSEVLAHFQEDQRALLRLLVRVGGTRHRAKEAAAVLAERLGRLKLNGRLIGRSPLTPVLELEVMVLAIEGRRRLWLTMTQLARDSYPDWDIDDLRRRANRAQADADAIDRIRDAAAGAALG